MTANYKTAIEKTIGRLFYNIKPENAEESLTKSGLWPDMANEDGINAYALFSALHL
ncbi:MAG: hypothetical protein WA139_01725 [Candidatus Aenigmatarchaeota archaeon]